MMQLHCLVLFALCYGALAMPRPENNGGVSSTDEDPPEEYLKMAIMKPPRCGVPDVAEYSTVPKNRKWKKAVLTYRIVNYTEDLTTKVINESIKNALNVWSQVTPLKFTQVNSDEADIEIMFVTGKHGHSLPFDGPNGNLAHASYPGSEIGVDVHFDDDEDWTNNRAGKNLFLVAAHEFGHSLGLNHSDVKQALMFKDYRYVETKNFRLSEDDIKGIQYLYGARPK